MKEETWNKTPSEDYQEVFMGIIFKKSSGVWPWSEKPAYPIQIRKTCISKNVKMTSKRENKWNIIYISTFMNTKKK